MRSLLPTNMAQLLIWRRGNIITWWVSLQFLAPKFPLPSLLILYLPRIATKTEFDSNTTRLLNRNYLPGLCFASAPGQHTPHHDIHSISGLPYRVFPLNQRSHLLCRYWCIVTLPNYRVFFPPATCICYRYNFGQFDFHNLKLWVKMIQGEEFSNTSGKHPPPHTHTLKWQYSFIQHCTNTWKYQVAYIKLAHRPI